MNDRGHRCAPCNSGPSMWKDFKAFAFKGSVIDLAVAVVIGAAFARIVTTVVEVLITPLIGRL